MTNFPFPFNLVQDWLENLYNTVLAAPFNAIQQLWNWIVEKVTWLSEQVSNAAGWLWDQIKPVFAPLTEWASDAVAAFWNGLKKFVEDPAGFLSDAWSWIVSQVNNAFEAFKDYISSGWQWITEQVGSFIDSLSKSVSSGIESLQKGLADGLNSLWEATKNGLSNVQTWITNSVNGLWDSLTGLAGDILAGVTEALGSGFQSFFEWMLKQLGWIAEMITGALQLAIDRTKDTINSIMSPIIHAMTDALMPGSPPPEIGTAIDSFVRTAWNKQLEIIEQAYHSPPDAESLWNVAGTLFSALMAAAVTGLGLATAADIIHPFRDVGIKVTLREAVYWSGIPAVTAAIATTPTAIGLLEPLRYALNERFQNIVPSFENLIRMRTKRLIDEEVYRKHMHMLGYNDYWLEHMLESMYDVPSISALTEMFWRGLITQSEFESTLRFIGVHEAYIDRYVKLTERIPSATDLIRFQLREVFRPERRPDLLAEYPSDEYFKWMAAQGYSKYWAENYWAAHWELPSITQLNEMLIRNVWSGDAARGKAVLDKGSWEAARRKDLENWYRYVVYNDYIPEAISWLQKIIYEPYTRVDARRMWALGVLSEEELMRNYLDLGYDWDHAYKMTLWTKVYERLPDLERMYRNGWITSDEFKAELANLGLSADQVDWIFKTVVPRSRIERVRKERDLTKTDILRLHRIGEIDDVQAMRMLVDLGYDETEAKYLLALNRESLETELRDLSTSQVLKAYRYEIMSRDEAKRKLLDIGWSENAAETLLKLEDVKLQDAKTERMRERDLSRSDIIKAIKRGIIDVETGYNYLGYLGYSDWEIKVIFALEGIAWHTGG